LAGNPVRGPRSGQDETVEAPHVRVTTTVAAPLDVVWAAVADPTRIAGWSPETTRATVPSGGVLPVGARFDGSNRHGAFRWTTQCVVVESTPGEAFSFDVSFLGLAVARWRYALVLVPEGVCVDEQWWDRRGLLMKAFGTVGTGVADRATHNAATMAATLEALKRDLEKG
jgi:uncharacterized protein YndB with AHSA1/START domain